MIPFEEIPLFYKVMAGILLSGLTGMVFYAVANLIDTGYILIKRRPLYRYIIPPYKSVTAAQEQILNAQFGFYQRLSDSDKRVFRHRLAVFLQTKTFVPRNGLEITNEILVLVGATAVMLTFGFRNYSLNMITHIIMYPTTFFSETNSALHKGEYNPKLRALVLSWEDFKEGYSIANDNLNLGIHEFAHAIHFNSLKNRDASATIFADSFKELAQILAREEDLRKRLLQSGYLRDYAYTNPYEFVAVIIESFIETPAQFRAQFPEVYAKTKQMLNFNFNGY
ncbi:zinc-dependent peptidase [Bizionia sediminis]|uniref:Zinc-dependent peptidase n=1 Tax=Bizionia sediminis TaxID=1737064 RepID=A0ABW5KSW4_9FLAO